MRGWVFSGNTEVTPRDLAPFSRQLSTLLSAGVPIVRSLTILQAQGRNPTFKAILGEVRTDIEAGLSISYALKKHPEAFPEVYTAMVKAGELGGILDTVLERSSAFLEAAEALRAKVKGALVYPGLVLAICGFVIVFLLTSVIPVFATIFESFGQELPLPTRIVLDLSNIMKEYWFMLVAGPVAVYNGFFVYYKAPAGRRQVDALALKAPVFGILLTMVAVARFARTLGTLIKSGVPIMQGLETVGATTGNKIIEEAVLRARESIRDGGRLADPLKKSGVFPDMATEMIGIGEETNALDPMLTKIADLYDQEVDAAVRGLTSLIEPTAIVLTGIVIGGMVIAMFLPMFCTCSLVE